MKQPFHATGLAAVILVAMLVPASAKMTGTQYTKEAKVTLTAARKIALKARPGQITDQELEREDGGSGLRYSFDIVSQGSRYEVGVDAKTGAILENGKEGKNPD
jgi:uncharacterized membrane protein YkoI